MRDLLFLIGAFDTAIIMALGASAAAVILLGKDAKFFWDRILPACLVLVGTSLAAGVAMAVTRWITGT